MSESADRPEYALPVAHDPDCELRTLGWSRCWCVERELMAAREVLQPAPKDEK